MLSEGDKKQIVQEIMKQSGAPDKDNVVKNFLNTLAENNRLGVLEPACEKFGTLMSAYRGEEELVVTSAAVCEYLLSLQRVEISNISYSHLIREFYEKLKAQFPSRRTSDMGRN